MRTANPVLSPRTFSAIRPGAVGSAMSVQGAVSKTGLVVTLIWLYVEILRLLVKLRGGRR